MLILSRRLYTDEIFKKIIRKYQKKIGDFIYDPDLTN